MTAPPPPPPSRGPVAPGAPVAPPFARAWVPTPQHPRSTLALVLGIVSVSGIVVAVTLLAAPLAWYVSADVMRQIDREPDRWSGRGQAKAGLVMGIAASALLVLVLLLLLLSMSGTVIMQSYDSGYPR